MNFGQQSLAEIQVFMADQRAIIASAMQAQGKLRMAMAYISEQTEVNAMLTCSDLVEQAKWLSHFCCEDCHQSGELYEVSLENGQKAELCHSAALLLAPDGLPSHAEECGYE